MTTFEGLRLGSFELHQSQMNEQASWRTRVGAEGTNFGNPEAVVEEIRSRLLDGSLARVSRHDNREIPIRLVIDGPTDASLADAEAALLAEVERGRNLLTWTPPLGTAESAVFEVVWADLELDQDGDWDLDELRTTRHYVLKLTCRPHVRSAAPVRVPGLSLPVDPASPPAPVTIDSGDSTTGWTSATNGTMSAATLPGYVTCESSGYQSGMWHNGLIAASNTHPYLLIAGRVTFLVKVGTAAATWQALNGASVRFSIDGTSISPTAFSIDAAGNFTAVIARPTAVASSIQVRGGYWATISKGTTISKTRIAVDKIERVATTGTTTATGRQQLRRIPVYGSRRTEAEIEVLSDDGADLGTVLVYTCSRAADSASFSPGLRARRLSGPPVSTDAATVSGGVSALGIDGSGEDRFEIRASTLDPGTYLVAAMLRRPAGAASRQVWFDADQKLDATGTVIGSATRTGRNVALTTTWAYHELGLITLPPRKVGALAATTVTCRLSASAANEVEWDEAWLFNVDRGQLSVVRDVWERLVISPATVDDPEPTYWIGDDASQVSDPSKVASFAEHQFRPGEVDVFTANTGSPYPAASLEYYPHWGTFPAAVPDGVA